MRTFKFEPLDSLRKDLRIDPSPATGTQNLVGFLPQVLASRLIDFVFDSNQLRRICNTVNMPARLYDFPIVSSAMDVYRIKDGVTFDSTNYTTGKVNLEAKKLGVQALVDSESVEDSVVDTVGVLLRQFAEAIADAEEEAIAVGNTAFPHTATTVASATSENGYQYDTKYDLFNGIWTRAQKDDAQTAVAGGSSDLSYTHINRMRFGLGKYGRNPNNVVVLIDDWQASRLLQDDDIKQVQITGMNKSPIITGELMDLIGMSVNMIPHGTQDVAVAAYRPYLILGDRRKVKVKSEEEIASDQFRYAVNERIDFVIADNAGLIATTGLSTAAAGSS
tara:strand:- start:25036 stop:26037 length:1002 start_codon:yes stop_codon:yes gene_type:complete